MSPNKLNELQCFLRLQLKICTMFSFQKHCIFHSLSLIPSSNDDTTNRETNTQTDRRTEFSSQDRVCITCSVVKTNVNFCSFHIRNYVIYNLFTNFVFYIYYLYDFTWTRKRSDMQRIRATTLVLSCIVT